MQLYYKDIQTPMGPLKLIANDFSLKAVLWEKEALKWASELQVEPKEDHAILQETEKQLGEYFAGKIKNFQLPVEPVGTQFQVKVWKSLLRIPYGETKSYSQIAEMIGQPKAVRAVGGANARNPLAVIIPCHRVIGSNGSLTGFAGSVLLKRILLSLETKVNAGAQTFSEGLRDRNTLSHQVHSQSDIVQDDRVRPS